MAGTTTVLSQHRRELLDMMQRRGRRSNGPIPAHFAFKIQGVPYSAFVWRSGVSRDSAVTALMVGRWIDKRMVLFQDEEAQELVECLESPDAWDLFVFYVEGWMRFVEDVPPVPPRRPRPGQPGWAPQDPERTTH